MTAIATGPTHPIFLAVALSLFHVRNKMTDNRRVSYFYDAEVGNYHYGQGKSSSKLECSESRESNFEIILQLFMDFGQIILSLESFPFSQHQCIKAIR